MVLKILKMSGKFLYVNLENVHKLQPHCNIKYMNNDEVYDKTLFMVVINQRKL